MGGLVACLAVNTLTHIFGGNWRTNRLFLLDLGFLHQAQRLRQLHGCILVSLPGARNVL